MRAPRRGMTCSQLRDLIRDLDVKLHAGEAGLDRPVRWVHISELLDPDAVAVRRRAAADAPASSSTDADSAREYLDAAGRPPARRAGLRHGLRPRDRPGGARRRRPRSTGSRCSRCPYEVPFIALTEKAFTHLVNEHYAVLQRAISAHERLERIVLSERGLDGVAAALSSLIGGPALIFDARGDVLARRAFKRELPDRTVLAVAAELRERAASRAPAQLRARRVRRRRRRARAGASRAAHPGRQRRRRRRRRGSWPRRTRAADRVRPPHAAPGRDRRRARAAAPARRRRHRAPAGRRRARGDGLRRAGRRRARAPARAVRPRRARRRGRAPARRAPCARPVEDGAAQRGARARRRAASSPAPAASRARCCRAARRGEAADDALFALAERVRRTSPRRRRAARRRRRPRRRRRRPAPRVPRGALRARGAGARRPGNGGGPGLATYRDLGSFQLLLSLQDDDALRLFCDSILAPIEDGRGRLRRRADALARGVHRVQRPVGAGREAALLPSSYAALSHPPRRGAHRPLARLRARPHRLLARAAGARAGPPVTQRSTP